MVRETSSVFSAISLGVFFSGSAFDQGDHPIQEAVAGIGGDADFQPVGHDGGAAGDRSRSRRRIPGPRADSPVMADSSTEAMPSMTSPSPGIISPADTITTSPFFSWLERRIPFGAVLLQQTGLGILLRLLQAGRLCFAPPFRHRFSEVGKQHRDEQDDADDDVIQAQIPASHPQTTQGKRREAA